jgi:hypothetical protein
MIGSFILTDARVSFDVEEGDVGDLAGVTVGCTEA